MDISKAAVIEKMPFAANVIDSLFGLAKLAHAVEVFIRHDPTYRARLTHLYRQLVSC